MSTYTDVPTCALPPLLRSWRSLVERSTAAWDDLLFKLDGQRKQQKIFLGHYSSLEEFLVGAPEMMMFWFFHRREAFLTQTEMRKWSKDRLDEYVLLPATPGSLSRQDCFFLSHYWRSKDQPDPDGRYLRLYQEDLQQHKWLYIWIDWTCTPQEPRSPAEVKYFTRSLSTVSSIIRNCGFAWRYPPFEPRLWILYEIAEYYLTVSDRSIPLTPDIQTFADHVQEMIQHGVCQVLDKYNYKCTYEHDKQLITSWLELLVLLKRLRVDIYDKRRLMDSVTWLHTCEEMMMHSNYGDLNLKKFEGTLIYRGRKYTFTPFPAGYTTSMQKAS